MRGSQGLSVPASWLASRAGGGAGSVPHFADDMMDYPCHYRYSQRHSATDKTDALLHAGKAAIFLPGFRGPARASVLPSGVGNVTLGQTRISSDWQYFICPFGGKMPTFLKK